MRIENTIKIAAPIEKVWDITLDVEKWPDHTPTMTTIQRLDSGPLKVGSKVRIKQPGQRAKVWTITLVDPLTGFAWSAKLMGMTMAATHQLTPSNTGTTNALLVDIEGGLTPLLGAILRGPILKAITTENLGLKAASER
jgi:carbon monoxide dehydrogenase subunit G